MSENKFDLIRFEKEISSMLGDDCDKTFTTMLKERKLKEACVLLDQKIDHVVEIMKECFEEEVITERINMIYHVKVACLLVVVSYFSNIMGVQYGLTAVGLSELTSGICKLLVEPFADVKKDMANQVIQGMMADFMAKMKTPEIVN